ncbi:hypothetical protein HII31_04013 [Pseudocercospora fuligena]|uniref:Uncharacterized protein n=1 Tax=Pseudocercospora fuligena TaxID=685502 RepID=A0A8H6VJD3_9PEZI|nr:hypothetical protein HII31_04013 [Pseudocercospora fuligena]
MSATTPSSANAPPNKPSPTANVKPSRLPAPTLFVGPPSRNASHLSISRQQTHESSSNAREPRRSALGRNVETASTIHDEDTKSTANRPFPAVKKASERSIEAKWKEMQSTLNEVEFTAQSSTHVFGEQHSKALDELRKAQVELARAWGRGNQDQPDNQDPTMNLSRFQGAEEIAKERRDIGGRRRGGTNTSSGSASTALSDETRSNKGNGSLEDETAQDIRLASERRAANEAYFKKVEGGVRDVVKKLEVVAEAMRGVEGESRSLWSSDSGMTGSGSVESGREEGVKR